MAKQPREQQPKEHKKSSRSVKTDEPEIKIKKEKVVEAAATPSPPPAPQPEPAQPVSEQDTSDAVKKHKSRRVVDRDVINDNLDKIIDSTSALEGKAAKAVIKELKLLKNDLRKVLKKKVVSDTKRDVSNSGFFKKVKITDDLAKFMSCKPDELKSRVDVTRYICNYVKDKNLQDGSNKKVIKPDHTLKKLLGPLDGDLTFPGVQKLIQKHFVKA